LAGGVYSWLISTWSHGWRPRQSCWDHLIPWIPISVLPLAFRLSCEKEINLCCGLTQFEVYFLVTPFPMLVGKGTPFMVGTQRVRLQPSILTNASTMAETGRGSEITVRLLQLFTQMWQALFD
jgi:hypothetical protein